VNTRINTRACTGTFGPWRWITRLNPRFAVTVKRTCLRQKVERPNEAIGYTFALLALLSLLIGVVGTLSPGKAEAQGLPEGPLQQGPVLINKGLVLQSQGFGEVKSLVTLGKTIAPTQWANAAATWLRSRRQ
jgi:hypothetical protein